MFKKLLESIRDFWHNHELYTPVSEMTKADIENIINRIKEKEELISKSNNCNNDYLEIKKYFKAFKLFLYLLLAICSILGAIGPGKDLVVDYLENKKVENAIINLNQVAENMYFYENSPIVALNTIEKSLSLDSENMNTIYLKTFIESMLSVELIKNLDRPYNEKELLDAQTALSNADFILESKEEEYFGKAYLIKAQTYFALNENDKALANIEKAIDYDPSEIFYKIRKATILIESKRYEDAEKILNELEKTSGNDKNIKNVYLWLGINYNEQALRAKNIEDKIKYNLDAKKYFEKSTKADNKFHIGIINLGNAYANSDDGDDSNNKDDFKKAVEQYNKVLSIRPNHKEAYYLLGKLYGSVDNYEKAELYFKKALEQDKNYFSANLWLGKVYFEIENDQAALEYLNKALQLKPDSEAYFMIGEIYQKSKNYKEAIKNYLEVEVSLSLNGLDNDYYKYRSFINRADISIELKDFENAKFFLDNIHNIDQSLDSNYYKTYFKYYKANSNYNSALDSINRAISLSNKQKDSLKLEKAIYLFENNKINETLEEIKILKSIKIEKKGLLEKVLKFEYDLYGKLNDYEMQNNILKEIKKYDPTFKK